MSEKWILSFSQKWVVGTNISMFQKNTRHIAHRIWKTSLNKVGILKNALLRKSPLKFMEDIKMKKIYISALPTPIWLWHVWSIHVLILQSSSKSIEQSANFRNILLRKLRFKFLEDIKTKKFISQHCPHQFGCETSEVYTYSSCKSSSKSFEECSIPLVNLAGTAFQKHSFFEFSTQFDPILGPPIPVLQAATKINQKIP